jgi:hypothetical protein
LESSQLIYSNKARAIFLLGVNAVEKMYQMPVKKCTTFTHK